MWPNPRFPADLVKFTEEIFNEKLDFYAVYTNKTTSRKLWKHQQL